MFRTFVSVFIIMSCFAFEGFGQVVIAQQDFEETPASPTMTFTNSGGGFSSGNIGPAGAPANANLFASGARGWQSTNLGTGVSSIEFTNVQISDYVSKYLTFRVGSFGDIYPGGMDPFYDRLEVFVSLDNGQSYSNELRFSAYADNQAHGFFLTNTSTVIYDGNNSPAEVLFGYGTLRINLPDNATQVKIRIAFQCISPETIERWVIDDVKIMGTPNSVSIGTISTSPICVGPSNPATATVGYTLVGMFGASNDLTAWLSDASGSFASETLIGTLEDINSNGSISITIPGNTPSGTGYKIRIKSNQPVSASNETAAFQIVNGVFNVGSPSATNWHEKSAVNWTNPAYCFDEIMIVAKAGSAVSVTPAGDGTGYNHNLNFGSGDIFDGGYVVFKGSTSNQIIKNLENDVTYHITFFTRKGTLWSEGITVTATPFEQLDAGDVAIIRMDTDPDMFSFVLLKDIPASQVINFTDNSWTGSSFLREGILTWTAPNTGLTKGTVVSITGSTSTSLGSLTRTSGYGLSTNGDQVFAFTGESTLPYFIAGISSNPWITSGSATGNNSYLPSALTLGHTALGFTSGVFYQQYFSASTSYGNRATLLAAINNPNNWTRSNSAITPPAWKFTWPNTSVTPSVPSGSSVSVNAGGNTGLSNITFTTVTSGGSITIDRFNNPPASHGLDGNVSGYTFIIEPDNSLVFNQAEGYSLRFDIASLPANFGISELTDGDNTSIKLYKRSTPGSGTPDGPYAMTYHRNGTDGNQSDDYLTSAIITNGFSEFFFQSENEPLPVELTSSTAKTQGTTVNLMWETKTEIDNNGFEVERNSGDTWQNIGFVEGHGTTNSPKYYNFTDKNATGNKIQYRLRQVDNDGTFEYSPVVEVELNPVQFALYQNYPNPFNPSTVIRYALPVAGVVNIDVFNALGEKVATLLNGQVEAGYHEVSFDAAALPSGLYLYKIQAGEFTSVKKMLLMK